MIANGDDCECPAGQKLSEDGYYCECTDPNSFMDYNYDETTETETQTCECLGDMVKNKDGICECETGLVMKDGYCLC